MSKQRPRCVVVSSSSSNACLESLFRPDFCVGMLDQPLHHAVQRKAARSTSLFNDRAWGKANNLLKEILLGHCSDPPRVLLCMHKLDGKGELKASSHGLPARWCFRGAGLAEAAHKQALMPIGMWRTGVEMAGALRAERHHRCNHCMPE